MIWRRRKKWGQEKAAKSLKVAYFTYKQAEYSDVEGFKYPAEFQFGDLTDSEKCLIYRKRAKLTQRGLAEKLGMSRHGLRLRESGVATTTKQLLNWWENAAG